MTRCILALLKIIPLVIPTTGLCTVTYDPSTQTIRGDALGWVGRVTVYEPDLGYEGCSIILGLDDGDGVVANMRPGQRGCPNDIRDYYSAVAGMRYMISDGVRMNGAHGYTIAKGQLLICIHNSDTPTLWLCSSTNDVQIQKPVSCDLSPAVIPLSTVLQQGHRNNPALDYGQITLSCTGDADVTIQTGAGEQILLGGPASFHAVLDWGAGYGNPGRYQVRGNTATNVRLRATIKGSESMGAGVYKGDAIVKLTLE